MSYVLVGILFLLIASALVAYLVMSASKRSAEGQGGHGSSDDRDDAGPPGVGPDESPLGDTTEHAGTTSSAGETVGEQDADEAGGTGGPVLSGDTDDRTGEPEPPSPDRRFQRDPVGGEAEARPFTDT